MSALEYKRCGHQICAARISEYTPPTCLRTRLAHKRKCTTLPVPQFSRARVSWRPFSPAIDHTPCTTPSKGVQQSGRALDATITPTRDTPHCYQRTTHQPTNTRRQRILASPSPASFLNNCVPHLTSFLNTYSFVNFNAQALFLNLLSPCLQIFPQQLLLLRSSTYLLRFSTITSFLD